MKVILDARTQYLVAPDDRGVWYIYRLSPDARRDEDGIEDTAVDVLATAPEAFLEELQDFDSKYRMTDIVGNGERTKDPIVPPSESSLPK